MVHRESEQRIESDKLHKFLSQWWIASFSERFGASIFGRVDGIETVKEAELSFRVHSTIGEVRSYFYKFEILGNVSCSLLL